MPQDYLSNKKNSCQSNNTSLFYCNLKFYTSKKTPLEQLHSKRKSCILQWIPAHVNIEGNECADSLAKEARDIEHKCTTITLDDCNAVAKHRIMNHTFKKSLVTEFDCPRIITSTIARLRTELLKGMKIHPDKTISYVQCKHCPDLQLTPNHILECPTVATKLQKMGMVPLRDSLRKILYSPDAPQIAEINPGKCSKCFSYTHLSRFCSSPIRCINCGESHAEQCINSSNRINCKGDHPANSPNCPNFIKEEKTLEFKCNHHLTLGEARRKFKETHSANYSTVLKTAAPVPNMEEFEKKLENIVANFQTALEKQTAAIMNSVQTMLESVFKHLVNIIEISKQPSSPNKEKKANIPQQKFDIALFQVYLTIRTIHIITSILDNFEKQN
ncbi:RNase H domain-containing protein [Trichonephila clavipes]|nr:RNase H domain-containing protein [Trichonephila clavipes]